MSKAQTPDESGTNQSIDLPDDMSKAEAREACHTAINEDTPMQEFAEAILDRL